MSDENKEEWEVRSDGCSSVWLCEKNGKVICEGLSGNAAALIMNVIADAHNASLSGEKEPLSDDVKAVLQNARKLLIHYVTALDAIYNHNEAARQACIQHFGNVHPVEVWRITGIDPSTRRVGRSMAQAAIAAPVTPKSEAWTETECCWCGQEMAKHDQSHDPRPMSEGYPVSSPAGSSTAHGWCPDCKQALSGDDWLDREVHGRCSSQGVAEAAGSSTKEGAAT